ncbi:MAG: radical SAM protein [Actinomycetia bacterium]|nr:radical SAM protein [Actinomycetes bacterium]
MSVQPNIFNIQRFSTHDGPGLRTTIFFKGCPLRCPWCHNPESVRFQTEPMPQADGKVEQVGRPYTVPELVAEIATDRLFYDISGGGATLSGGEVMAQDFAFVVDLVTALRDSGFDVAIDTSGVAPTKRFERMAALASRFLYDLKFINDADHKRWTGRGNALVLENLARLNELGATIHLRMILLDGLNTAPETIDETMDWLTAHDIALAEVNLLPYHRFGMDKTARLGRAPQEFTTPSADTMRRIEAQVRSRFEHVTIGG